MLRGRLTSLWSVTRLRQSSAKACEPLFLTMIYLLDTNMAAYIVSGRSMASRGKLKEAMEQATVAVSVITQAEILFGAENKPEAHRLRSAIEEFFETIQVFSWDSKAARVYGKLRASLSASGKSLSAMDMLIAAHALAVGAVLVTHDKAFRHAAPLLEVVDWAVDL
jgi:tRNA(fMet)-specific endonuclease VapC